MISEDYVNYGHQPPGRGPQGARADYDAALRNFGHIRYTIDALVSSGENVSAAWTGALEGGRHFQGLSLYRVVDGKIVQTTNTTIGDPPEPTTSASA